jgi:HEAT repeat protein
VSIKGSSYSRFRRALETGRLSVVLMAASELEHIGVDDALEILILMAREKDPRFDRAAARWVGRLLAEHPVGLAEGRYALALVERLPGCAETLRHLARRR